MPDSACGQRYIGYTIIFNIQNKFVKVRKQSSSLLKYKCIIEIWIEMAPLTVASNFAPL